MPTWPLQGEDLKAWQETHPPPEPHWSEQPGAAAGFARMRADNEARCGIHQELLHQLGAPARPREREAFNQRLVAAVAIHAGAPYTNVDAELAGLAAGGLAAIAEAFCAAWFRPDEMRQPRTCLRLALNPHGSDFKRCLKYANGSAVGLSDLGDSLALGSGDFVEILADATPRIFQGWAPVWAPSWERIGTTVFVDRWDPVRTFFMEPHPSLPEIPEGATFESVRGIADTGITYTMHRYGALWSLTSPALLGDDRDALSRPILVFGSAAFVTEDDKFWAMITDNAAMEDGVALFDDAAHGNLITPGTALSAANLTIAQAALLAQVAASGESLRLKAKHLIVPVALSATAAALLKTLGNDTAEPQDRLTLTVEPRLDVASTTAWYLACDPARHPLAEMAFLGAGMRSSRTIADFMRSGRQPRVSSMWSWNDDALKAKISHLFGCRIVDHRGWVKNLGA